MPIRILLADDQPLFIEGLSALLQSREEFKVIGIANSGDEAVSMAREQHPELVVTDLRMPEVTGIEVTRQIKADAPETRIIILTVSEEREDLIQAIRAGAQGYLLKNLTSEEVFDLLKQAAAGEAVFTPHLASQALLVLSGNEQKESPDDLTPREREVLQVLASGHSNAGIAEQLHISETTVRFHLRNILAKLQADNRTEAVITALKQHIITLSDV
ncbi:MAG TPA: response regulator transcription factor [bacterium]|nr:response regulator transcription factor [bacterium]